MSSVLIRHARESDSARLADVHLQCWRETYAGALPADTLAALPFDAAMWRERVHSVAPSAARSAVWVAERDDDDREEIVGFATVGPDPDEEGVGRLFAIYVLRAAQGQGVGRRLHQQALASLDASGFDEATLWVAASNMPAIRFYELADWRSDRASRVEDFSGTGIKVVRFRRPLPAT